MRVCVCVFYEKGKIGGITHSVGFKREDEGEEISNLMYKNFGPFVGVSHGSTMNMYQCMEICMYCE